ncbi:MAG TPA: histidine phosphatase family protein, partial [Candidatus Binatus sp.]|nr:histidine phosphatase family protein [Candidatus Binatus sp.]
LLRAENLSAIYASDLKRARRTAEVISQPHNLPVLIEDKIRELDHGKLEGLTFNEIRDKFGDFLDRWRSEPADLQVPGGERLADVAERSWQGLRRIVEHHSAADNIVVVSHNFPIVGIVCRITGTHLNDYRNFHLDPCGISRLHFDQAGRWQVTEVNSHEYPARSDRQTEIN